MVDHDVTPVILCGGSGTRLWPVSRRSAPKQFVSLLGGRSLFQETALRAQRVAVRAPIVVCNEEHLFVVRRQLDEVRIDPSAIICEPVSRNTAPAVAAAALLDIGEDPDALLLVLPSDHLVPDPDVFAQEIERAAEAAREGLLVTLGIAPTGPHTGYGYIRQGAALIGLAGIHVTERFVEKPDVATASRYVSDPKWLWNSGMFLLPASVLLSELAVLQPQVLSQVQRAMGARQGNVVTLSREAFEAAPAISLDYAVMERTQRGAVLPTPLRWSDVGAWSSLWEISEKDEGGNVSQGDVMTSDAHNCYLHSDGPLIAALGVSNVTVVATEDAVLVADIGRSQEVKELVDQLHALRRTEADAARITQRPWGTYQGVHRGSSHQVKHIVVAPGQKLSLQRHQHRAEHWFVVQGIGRAVRGEELLALEPNDTVYIPQGCVHRVENPGSEPLHLIEVQFGDYLGEDDIERLEDAYGRC